MEIKQGTKFERAAAGFFLGRLIDVVDMPGQQVVYNNVAQVVDKVRIVWVLGNVDGTAYLNKEGKPFTVALIAPAKISPKSTLGKALVQILGTSVPVGVSTTDQLAEILLANGGRTAQLFLVKSENKEDPSDPYTNIQGYAPLTPGQIAPAIPAGFVRDKFAPKDTNGKTAYSTPQVAAAAASIPQPAPPAVAPATLPPQFTPEQIAAFIKSQQPQALNTVSLEQPKVNQPF
jgi:hypothetical protein